MPKFKHTSCKVIAFMWPIPLKRNYQKRKKNSNTSDIFDFIKTFQDIIFQSI